jgi:hypothetical protein
MLGKHDPPDSMKVASDILGAFSPANGCMTELRYTDDFSSDSKEFMLWLNANVHLTTCLLNNSVFSQHSPHWPSSSRD